MKKKKQHYIPQFHLRKWSRDGKHIALFNKNNGICVNGVASIKNMAAKDYLYGKDDKIENYLGKIEARISPIYDKIITSKSLSALSEEDVAYLLLHITLCNERTLGSAERFEDLVKATVKESIAIKQAHGQDLDIDTSLIDDHVKIVNPCNMSMNAAFDLFPVISDLKMLLIRNTSNNEFVTSDYPAIKYNLWSNKRNLYSGWGLSSVGLMFFVPISPQFAILLYDSGIYKIDKVVNNVIIINKKAWIDEVNKLMLLNANSNIFFSENIPPKYITKLYASVKEHEKNHNSVSVFGNNESKLIVFSGKRIIYQPKLSHIEIYPGALELPVPRHAQGLLRPESERIAKEIKEIQKREENNGNKY